MMKDHLHQGNFVKKRKFDDMQLYFETRADPDNLEIKFKTLN